MLADVAQLARRTGLRLLGESSPCGFKSHRPHRALGAVASALLLHRRGRGSESLSAHMKELTVKVGVGVLIRKNRKILLIKRKGAHGEGTWAPPGGHIDFGESVIDCAKREVKEEVEIKIKNLKVLGFTEDLFKKDKKHYITVWVDSEWKSGKIKNSGEEFSEARWFPWKKLPKPLFVSLKNFVKKEVLPE